MKKNNNIILTDYEFIFTTIGCIMGMGILSLPNTAVSIAKQDGWISTILGSVYPLYIVLMASIILKRNPNTNIMDLSKKYLGKIFGNLLNFLFMAQFLYFAIMVISAGISLLITYAVWFMTPFKVALILVCLVVYGSYKGLKVLSRINVISFFAFISMMLVTFIAFKHGSLLNVQPVFGTEIGKIAKAGISTSFAYANMEVILIIHTFVNNKDKIIKSALKCTLIVTLIYTWSVFTAIFYMGPDIVPKSFWPFYFVSESVRIPVVNNFRFIIMIFWPFFIYKTVANEYFLSASIMDSITGIDYKKWCIFLSPIILFLPILFENEIVRRNFSDSVTPFISIFNLSYITLIAIFVVKKSNKQKSNAS